MRRGMPLLDADGERIRTAYSGQMPEAGKATLKRGPLEEAGHVLQIRPDLEVVVLADGAADNWNWFSRGLSGSCPSARGWSRLPTRFS